MKLLNNLYKILEQSDDLVCIQLSHKSHPVFKAHFPDNPILPGFLQIDILAEILGHKIKLISKAKYISLIKPDDIIEYNIKKLKDHRFKVIIKNNDKKKISEIIYEI